jgi:hypothetical protein
MGSKQRRVIIMFLRHTLETTIFKNPRERPPRPTVEDRIRKLYTEGFHPQPTPVLARAELLPVVDEDRLYRLYTTTVSLMPKRRSLTRDQMLAVTAKMDD